MTYANVYDIIKSSKRARARKAGRRRRKMSIKKFWDMVNNCSTLDAVNTAEKALIESDLDNETYNDLMMALSYISRELYKN